MNDRFVGRIPSFKNLPKEPERATKVGQDEVDRASEVVRERDVLERLRAVDALSTFYPLAADAIAEIKRARETAELREETYAVLELRHNYLKEQLRQYTEAEPAQWQARKSVHGHLFGWMNIYSSEVEEYRESKSYEVRALIVAPKGDTE